MAGTARKRFKISPPLILIGGALLLVLIVAWFMTRPKADFENYQTQPVSVGSITKSVSASGTLQALVTVDVGSQVSGQLSDVYVDFDDNVVQGQVLAQIDPETQDQRLESAQAELRSAEQSVNSARANLAQTRANAQVTEADYNRTVALFEAGIVAPQALEKAEAQLASSRAQIQVSEASVTSSESRKSQVEASLRQAQIDRNRTVITSPITGVVVDRQVDPGSTVAASLNAPVLFKIAQDLSDLELKILVDEADIGQVSEGQQVNFTVDAYPDRDFTAVITQVRKQPESSNNVVTYVVIAEADNPDMSLLPGMTANAEIILEDHPNVIRVPSTALNYQPYDPNMPRFEGGGGGGFGGPQVFGGGGGFRGGPPGGFGGRGGFGGGNRGNGGGGNQGQFAFDQLTLEPAQKERIEQIFANQRREMAQIQVDLQREMARGGEMDREGMQERMRELNTKYREQAEAVLNPEQLAELERIRSTPSNVRRDDVYVLRDGEPYRIGVGVGVSDGSNVEVISDAFKQGDVVIVAGGLRAPD